MKPTPDKLIELGRELFELSGVKDADMLEDAVCLSHGSIAWKLCERLREELEGGG